MRQLFILSILIVFTVSCSTEYVKPDITGEWKLINTFDGTFNINWNNGRGISINEKLCDCNILDTGFQIYDYTYTGLKLCVENHIYEVCKLNDTLILTENDFVSTFIRYNMHQLDSVQNAGCF